MLRNGFLWLLERSSLAEIIVKNIYWRSPLLISLRKRIASLKTKQKTVSVQPLEFDDVITALQKEGVVAGGILVVHSSFRALKGSGLTPDQIIDKLKGLVGESGTLAMPAIAVYPDEPQGTRKLDDSSYLQALEYDKDSENIGTGLLPKFLMRREGSIRSPHPLNSMVAWGPHAKEMMSQNLKHALPTPCGVGSSWHYCYSHNATIVALGTDMAHRLTMIHVAEDAFEEEWPVGKWYRTRNYKLVGDGETKIVGVRERKHKWSICYAERSFSADLFRLGVARHVNVSGVKVALCKSQNLIEYLRAKRPTPYPYRISSKNFKIKG